MIRPTWAEIDLKHIAHNIAEYRKMIPAHTRILVAVKADGYGHGAVSVAKQALSAGVSYLAVATVEEGIELRDAGIQAPVLILGYVPPSAAEIVIEKDLTPAVFQNDLVEALANMAARVGKKAKVHVKVDTGMGRIGLQAEEAADFIEMVSKRDGIEIEGLFSHFATADAADKQYAERQILRWKNLLQELEKRNLHIPLRHIANSAAAIEFPEAAYDMVRMGIALYGLYPSKEVNHSKVQLRQALRLVTKIVYLKTLPCGAGVSYGATKVKRDHAVIATLPIGYGDGYSRLLSGKAQVLIRGKRAPVFGRICMDQCMVDVTDIEGVSVGDEVVLYGGQQKDFISLDEVADWMGTISYEVACNLSKRVPRIYNF